MSGGLRLHVALAAAGLVLGLPIAAALQWTRPDPGTLWYDASDRGTTLSRTVLNAAGSRSTLVSTRGGSRAVCNVALRPMCLNAVAARLGGTPRWDPAKGPWGVFGSAASEAGDGWWRQRTGDWRWGEIEWYCGR